MKRIWMTRAAGILCIIAGVLILVIVGWVVDLNVGGPSHEAGYAVIFLALFVAPISILLIILEIFPIVGGICALKRRRWGLALAGSICVLILGIALGGIGAFLFASALSSIVLAFVVFVGLALLPLIFVILGKREFK